MIWLVKRVNYATFVEIVVAREGGERFSPDMLEQKLEHSNTFLTRIESSAKLWANMHSLHESQERILGLLKKHQTDPLTIRELQEELGISSPSVVMHHIRQLEEKGYLRRNPSNPRDYQIVADGQDKKIAYLNLYGLAQCGPNGACLEGNPIESVPISTKILGFPSADAFLVKAKGTSMVPKIHNNDLVIVKKTNVANNGDVVVCVNGGEALIKRIQKSDGKIILMSENKEYEPFIASDDFRVEGIVKGVLSYAM